MGHEIAPVGSHSQVKGRNQYAGIQVLLNERRQTDRHAQSIGRRLISQGGILELQAQIAMFLVTCS